MYNEWQFVKKCQNMTFKVIKSPKSFRVIFSFKNNSFGKNFKSCPFLTPCHSLYVFTKYNDFLWPKIQLILTHNLKVSKFQKQIILSSHTPQNQKFFQSGRIKKMKVQSNLVLRNGLIRNKLVLRNHFPMTNLPFTS